MEGTIDEINWSDGIYWLEISIDINGGQNYKLMGSSQILSVPYAIYAEKSKSSDTSSYTSYSIKADTANFAYNLILSSDQGEEYKLVIKPGCCGDNELDIIRLNPPPFKFEIRDISNWTLGKNYDVVSNAVINLYKNQSDFDLNIPSYTATSNDMGLAEISGLPDNTSFLVVIEKGDLSNTKDGFIIDGIFQSQAEIDMSPQPSAQVGDIRFKDVNGDGIISNDDKAYYDIINTKGSGEYDIEVFYIGK